jgi:5-methylthioadenosine/S-adenosylhomocysteine deaminase
VWEIGTGARSPLSPESGKLDVGELADFLLLRTDVPELTLGDPTANLVYATSGPQVVDTTVVAGRVLMRGGEIDGLAEIRARVQERAKRLGIT